jgi:cytoskeletal protein RodZ
MERAEAIESPGKYLRSKRESRRLPLSTVAHETRIRETILKAIEEDHYEDLPRLYMKGFLSAYARCLGLDPNDVLSLHQKYMENLHPSKGKVQKHQPAPRKKGTNVRWLVIAISVLFVALLIYASIRLLPRFLASLRMEESGSSSSSPVPSSPPVLRETEPLTAEQPVSNNDQPEDTNADKDP